MVHTACSRGTFSSPTIKPIGHVSSAPVGVVTNRYRTDNFSAKPGILGLLMTTPTKAEITNHVISTAGRELYEQTGTEASIYKNDHSSPTVKQFRPKAGKTMVDGAAAGHSNFCLKRWERARTRQKVAAQVFPALCACPP